MQHKVQGLVLDDDNDEDKTAGSKAPRCVKSIGADDDDGYFSTYSHFAIHHEMLTVSSLSVMFDDFSMFFFFFHFLCRA